MSEPGGEKRAHRQPDSIGRSRAVHLVHHTLGLRLAELRRDVLVQRHVEHTACSVLPHADCPRHRQVQHGAREAGLVRLETHRRETKEKAVHDHRRAVLHFELAWQQRRFRLLLRPAARRD
eukprot:3342776-Rhodomonas_salina.4